MRIKKTQKTALLFTIFLLVACSDPYLQELPASGLLTPEQVEDYSDDLTSLEKSLFLRWSERMKTADRFSGESIPTMVEIALINQREFEQRADIEAKRITVEKAKIAAEDALRNEKIQRDQVAHEELIKIDQMIKTYLRMEPVSYNRLPIFNSFGYADRYEWKFDFKLTNTTSIEIIGITGLVTIRDAFQNELGTYNLEIEPQIGPHKTINYSISLAHNPKDPAHVKMLSSKTLYFDYLFNRLAFRDGKVIQPGSPEALQNQPASLPNPPTI